MYILYTLIALVVIFFIVSSVIRKQIYKEVDRLEDWKNDILHRPIPDEIGRVKQLKMSGETEEKFEQWRSTWDEIVSTIIPDVGERLFDIEDFAAKYRFQKARQLIAEINERLSKIEDELAAMTEDIQHLVESAEQNETEITPVREQFRKLHIELTKKRGLLGAGVKSFDERMKQMEQLFQQFEAETSQGSYLQARDVLLKLRRLLDETSDLLERYPKLLIMLEKTIPNEIKTFREGVKEMEAEGYVLESFDLPTRIAFMEDELAPLKEQLTALACDEVEKRIDEMTAEIDRLYELLEHEVLSHQYIVKELPTLKNDIVKLEEEIDELIEETTLVKESYHIPQERQEEQEKMKDNVLDLSRQLTVIEEGANEKTETFTTLREMVDEWKDHLTSLRKKIHAEKEALYKLREEEWHAKETLHQLQQRLLETKRLIQKSNVIGMPKGTIERLEACEKKLLEAAKQLEEIPLELGRIAVLVHEAKEAVEENAQLVEETIKTADLAEKVIQFGNRYRSRSEAVHRGLLEAEQLFRQCEYEEALQHAVQVIEPFEPNVIERVKEYSQQVL